MAKSVLFVHYASLKKLLKQSFEADFSPDSVWGCYIAAAYSKSFKFNLAVNNYNPKNAFFFTPGLRGICEDLITLKFIQKQKTLDRNKLLNAYTLLQITEMSEVQKKFFQKNHPQQIIFQLPDLEKVQAESLAGVKDQWANIGLNKDKVMPTVSHMATDAGLVELYEYVYSATSDMVHFSPHNLMRSGWSKKQAPFHHYFDVENFYKYYDIFNRFYGSYLFQIFSKTFEKELALTKPALLVIKKIEEEIRNDARWPELITFEEMNHPQAEPIRLLNTIRKLKQRAKELNIPEEEANKDIKQFVGGFGSETQG